MIYGQAPIPGPLASTEIKIRDEESSASVTVTVAGGVKPADGLVRRMVNVVEFGGTLAVTLALLDDAVYEPEAPERVTVCAAQLVNVTLDGLAASGPKHAPAPPPTRLTVTFAVLVPSETPTFTGPGVAGDGLRRLMVTVLPEIEATMLSLPEFTK